MATDTDNTKTGSQDYLGYSVYAQTLWARIARALNKDLQTKETIGDDPLVVGIFGEWGSGKSKLLKLIEERANIARDESIARHKYDGYQDLLIPVFFSHGNMSMKNICSCPCSCISWQHLKKR
ncbi:MAG: hypothetical protein HC858_06585 [Brachymonas sp.]|nr:hypothetical protein [Brachymonas sp.]